MKKLVLFLAAATMAVSGFAQEESAPGQEYGLRQSKFFDNVYVGINGGVATKTTGHKWLSDLDPNAGLRIGKNLTPVFGLAIEGNAYFSNKPWKSTGTVVRAVNTSLLGTFNLSNLFCGYKGDPRTFEVTAVYGLGYAHMFTSDHRNYEPQNRMTSKAGLDLQFNLGKSKQWQIYVEPSITWAFLGQAKGRTNRDGKAGFGAEYGYKASSNGDQPMYNINNSFVQLNAGVVYKFKNHDGRHNFTLVRFRDQAEIDALNAQINELRNRKPEVITKTVEVPAPAKEVSVENLVFVTFAQGSANLTSEAKSVLDAVKEGTHVQIVGTASPEGPRALNNKLSQMRADNAASYLKSRGVVVDQAVGKGVQGVTSNRLAVVYVK